MAPDREHTVAIEGLKAEMKTSRSSTVYPESITTNKRELINREIHRRTNNVSVPPN